MAESYTPRMSMDGPLSPKGKLALSAAPLGDSSNGRTVEQKYQKLNVRNQN